MPSSFRQIIDKAVKDKRFLVVPGESGSAGAAQDAPAPAGGVQEEALNNPLVQRAREIFKAEVRSVLDLRQEK